MAKRNVIAVPLDDGTVDVVDADCRRTGMGKSEFFRRLVAWYSSQDEVSRGVMLGTLPQSITTDVARVMLERIAAGGAAPNYQRRGGPGRPKGGKKSP